MRKVLVVICSFLSVVAFGQKVWTLEECINTAIERNLAIKNTNLNLRSAEVDINQAQHSRYPSLNGSVGLNLNLGRSIDPTSNTFVSETFFANNYSLNTGVILYNGGRINNTIKQAEMNIKSSLLTKEQIERDIALNVATSYLNVLFTKENIKIADINYEATKAQVDQMAKLIERGARAISEKYSLDAQLANNAQMQIGAKNNYDIAILQLKQQLLIGMNEPFEIAEVGGEIAVTTDPDLLNINELYDIALKNQKSVKAAEMNVKAAEIGQDIAKSQLLPTVSVGGSLGTTYSNKGVKITGVNSGFEDVIIIIDDTPVTVGFPFRQPEFENNPYSNQLTENFSYGAGLNIAVPIYNNYGPKGSIERSKINTERSLVQLDQERQTLMLNVQQALADAKASKSSLLASRKSFEAQELAYNNAKKRFDIDAIGVFELTNIKSLYDNANINLLLAKYDYVFKTKVLDFYLGKPIKL